MADATRASAIAPKRTKAMRSDARDNRARIIEVATDVIDEFGTMASLNEIAKRAEIGPGTLYRHFPTREDLLAEVLTAWVGRVQEAAEATVIESRDDLVDYLERLAETSNAYTGLSASMAASMDDAESPMRDAHRAVTSSIDLIFDKARQAGLLAGPVDGAGVGRLVTGVAMVTDQAHLTHEQSRTMLSVILDGLTTTGRPGTA